MKKLDGTGQQCARSTVAEHYASWPVVSIELDNETYLTSLSSMHEAYRQFITWTKTALKEVQD